MQNPLDQSQFCFLKCLILLSFRGYLQMVTSHHKQPKAVQNSQTKLHDSEWEFQFVLLDNNILVAWLSVIDWRLLSPFLAQYIAPQLNYICWSSHCFDSRKFRSPSSHRADEWSARATIVGASFNWIFHLRNFSIFRNWMRTRGDEKPPRLTGEEGKTCTSPKKKHHNMEKCPEFGSCQQPNKSTPFIALIEKLSSVY